jgi:hypothetical protein
MTLPTSGALHLAQIGYEAGKPLMSKVDMNATELRQLCNKLTAGSQISVRDFYGTAYGVGPGYGPQVFTDITGAGLNVMYPSGTIYLHDAPEGGTSLALQSTVSALYSINGGPFVDKGTLGTVQRGDSIALKVLTSQTQQTPVSAQIVYAGITKSITITTGSLLLNHVSIRMYSYAYLDTSTYIWTRRSHVFSEFGNSNYNGTTYGGYVYAGQYTPGTWLPPAASSGVTFYKYWLMPAMPGDFFYLQYVSETNETKNIPVTSADYVKPALYMGVSGWVAEFHTTNGFRFRQA